MPTKRFYAHFYTTLPDQFVERNWDAVSKFAGAWDSKAYSPRGIVIDTCSISLNGNPKKQSYPFVYANSPTQIDLWMAKHGDDYNGRYWDTFAPGGSGANAPTSIRTAIPTAAWRTITNASKSGYATPGPGGIAPLSMADYARMMQKQQDDMIQAMLYGTGPLIVHPGTMFFPEEYGQQRPALRRDGFLSDEIVAYRCWRLEHAHLRSVYQPDVWYPGKPLQGREIEDWGERGIHAWKDASSEDYHHYIRGYLNRCDESNPYPFSFSRPAMVTGTVYLWGDVVEHQRGYRAEWASIRSLDWLYPDETMMGREHQVLTDLRAKYGVTDAT